LIYVIYTLFFITCIILVGSVLLQPGKTDAGALFTSNISNAAFAPRGTTTVLARITIAAGAAFIVLALLLSMPAFQGGVSVLQSSSVEEQSENQTNGTAANNSNPGSGVANSNGMANSNTEAPANPNSGNSNAGNQ
jgi:preprotein translocase subunit SecG